MSTRQVVTRYTTCTRDCPDACRIQADVAQTDAGPRVVQLRGDRQHTTTAGFLCYRTNQFLHRQYAEDRILTPLMRKAGHLVTVGWDEALESIAAALLDAKRAFGPESIFHYRGGGTLGLVTAAASDLFFEQLGPVTVKRGDICSGAGEAAQEMDFGVSDSSHISGLEKARNILIWGKNVTTSSPHTVPYLRRAKAAGAELMCIDPVHHATAKLCNDFVQPRPGTDLMLALAVGRRLFETERLDPQATARCTGLADYRRLCFERTVDEWAHACDLSTDVVDDLAERLANGPTTILIGWGMSRRFNGGATVRAIDALAAITGNLGRTGAGASFYYQRKTAFRSISGSKPAPRTICEPLFGKEVLAAQEPPIRFLWVTASNPVAMLPDSETVAKAIKSRPFVVVVDNWMSDTAALADIVLPVTTLLEADDLLGAYGHHQLGVAKPVVPPPTDVKTDLEIFQALAPRVGLDDYLQGSADDVKRMLLGPQLNEQGVTIEALETGQVVNPVSKSVLFEDGQFDTPSGQVELLTAVPSRPEDLPPPDANYPLTLLSCSTPRSQSSQWAKGEAPKEVVARVHPDAVAPLEDGCLATLRSAHGALTVRLMHDTKQRSDVVIVPKGGHVRNRTAANLVIAARLTDIGEGGALYDEPVRIEALAAD